MNRLALLAFSAAALAAQDPAAASNPFFHEWKTPFGVPPFAEIKEEHFLPALKEGIARQQREVRAIAESTEAPTFRNTLETLDRSGYFLERVQAVFGNLTGADTNPKLQAINREAAPLLTAHRDDIALNDRLWLRVKTLWERRGDLKLNPEQARLLELRYKAFQRAGAALPEAKKALMRELNAELSKLSVAYGDKLLEANKGYRLVLEKPEDLAGLPEGVRLAAAAAAKKAGLEGKWVITLDWPSLWPFETYSSRRDLRQRIMAAYLDRCAQGGAQDTRKIAARIASLRVEKAQLLGYKTWADYTLEENMAKNAAGVYGLLDQIWKPALEVAKRERGELQAMMDKELPGQKLEPWDWRYFAEKVRKAKFAFDEQEVKPYFPLDQVREGAFHVAGRLYGVTFTERKDIPVYNPEVKAFEVKEKDGSHLGVLLVDNHPRPGKRGGAWCSAYRAAAFLGGRRVPAIMVNVCNFTRPAGDAPALLGTDEVRTLFHEFGHALNGLFYQGRYRGTQGTPRDFVELPSQVMENWAMEPEVLKTYARHWKTGELIPAALIEKMKQAATFGQGFGTVEYMGAALLDLDWHTLADTKERDAAAFEKASLAKWGMLPEIPPRYRTPYFNHIWASGYSAGYYSYIWSAVLDSDAFQAFKEKGDLFDPAIAASFRENILSKGGSADPADLFRRFRGRDPQVDPLLRKRGLK